MQLVGDGVNAKHIVTPSDFDGFVTNPFSAISETTTAIREPTKRSPDRSSIYFSGQD
jgi:hypothetical protein